MTKPKFTEEEVDTITSELRVELEVLKDKLEVELTKQVRHFRDSQIRRLLVDNPTWDADFVRSVAKEILPLCLGEIFDHEANWARVLSGQETH